MKKGLLRHGADCDQVDLIELVVLNHLMRCLQPKQSAAKAWAQVRSHLRASVPHSELTMVWNARDCRATVTSDLSAIVHAVRIDDQVQVFHLGALIARAREAYRRDATEPASSGGRAVSRHQRKSAS